MENEIKLVVKSDSFKALKNYIHNELKIDKPTFEKMLCDYAGRYVTQSLTEARLESIIERKIASILGTGTDWRTPLKKKIEDNVTYMVNSAVDKMITSIVRETAEQIVRKKLQGV